MAEEAASKPVAGTPIVIDTKFGELCQAGFAGDDVPKLIFPLPKEKKDDLESLYRDIFEKLAVDPSQHPVLLTEEPDNRDGLFQHNLGTMMFDTFKVPAMWIAIQPVLSLYASGQTTGCVLESNETGLSYIVPIHQGSALIKDGITRFDVNGDDLTDYMMKILNERGYPFKTQAEHEIVRDCKEKLSYVALDYEEEFIKTKEKQATDELEKNYQLPDGQVITVGNERFRCPEVMFKPHLIGRESAGVHQLIYDTIIIFQGELREALFGHIVLSGSNTIFEGFAERLKKEILALAPQGMVVNIVAPPGRKYTSWVGGSILATHEQFQKEGWITKKEFEEKGAIFIHQKLRNEPLILMS